MMAMHVRQEPTPLADVVPEVPPDTAALIHEMLAKDAAARPDMSEVAARLEESAGGLTDALPILRAAAGAPAPARRAPRLRLGPGSVLRRRAPWLIAGSLLLALTAGGAGWYAWLRARQAKEPAWVLIGEKGDRPPWVAPPVPAPPAPAPGNAQTAPPAPAPMPAPLPSPASAAQQTPRAGGGKTEKKKRSRDRASRRKRGAKKDAGGPHGDP
jgi:hypothetical protein